MQWWNQVFRPFIWPFFSIADITWKVYLGQNILYHVQKIWQPMWSLPKQITIHSFLYKTNICLMWPATMFLSPKWKETCLKQALENFVQRRNGKQTNMQCLKTKCLCDYILSIATLYCKVCLMPSYKSWTIYKIIWNYVKVCKIIEVNFFLFSLSVA